MNYKDINRYMFEDIQMCMEKIHAFDRLMTNPDLDSFWDKVPPNEPVGHQKIVCEALEQAFSALNRAQLNWLAASKFNNAAVDPLPKRETV